MVAEAPDTTAPVINYSGETAISVAYAGTFTNPTVTATDNKDGSITPVRTIKYNNATVASVDTTKSGVYTLEYVATDAAGNKSTTLTITVTVEAQPDVATVTLDKTTASIVVGANTTVKVGVTPANAKVGFVAASEDDTIAKATYVSTASGLQTWKIDGLKAGTAKITFTSNYNAEAKKEIVVTVTAAG
ncbi:Bacterial Ig-like domain (group 2) [compost metagenome]